MNIEEQKLWDLRSQLLSESKEIERRLNEVEQKISEYECDYSIGDMIIAESKEHGLRKEYRVTNIKPAFWLSEEIRLKNGYSHSNYRVFVTTFDNPDEFELLSSRLNGLEITIIKGEQNLG